jgi:transposase
MLATASCQLGFLDAAGLMGPLPGGSFFALLAEHGDRIVRDEDFVECYSERMGRPSIAPSLLAKVLLLQYRCGLSDEQAMEAVAWDLRWKVALDLPVDHHGWHPTSLTKFRARLLLHGKERLALENSLRLAGELGMLDAPAEQIVDSTPMLGAAATQDTVRLVRHGVRKLIDAVAAVDERAARSLADGLEFDYEDPSEKPDCRWRIKAERERMLSRVAQDAERALRAVEQAEGLLDDEAIAEACQLLRDLIGQDFDIDDDGVPRLHRGTRQGRIISTVDPEMRHGRKSESQRFDGFKLHIAVTNSEQPLVTAVEVGDASAHDGSQAKELIDQQPQEARPERILGDSAYGDQQTREDMEERGVEVLARVPEGEVREGRIGKREFHIDLEAGTVTCPQGHVVAIPEQARRDGERVVNFGAHRCNDCPLKSRCAPYAGGRKLTIARREDLLQAGRTALQDAGTEEHLRRTRPRIERLIGVLANRYGARRNRYLGSDKGRLQASWAAALVNLNPIGHRLATQAA